MNMKRNIRTPKFVIADIDSSTVDTKFLKSFHDLMSLKILRSLKVLRTESPDFSLYATNSIILRMTIIPSNMLKLSARYFLNPSPKSFNTISHPKTMVKTKLATS